LRADANANSGLYKISKHRCHFQNEVRLFLPCGKIYFFHDEPASIVLSHREIKEQAFGVGKGVASLRGAVLEIE
jgi:hypothetical protein